MHPVVQAQLGAQGLKLGPVRPVADDVKLPARPVEPGQRLQQHIHTLALLQRADIEDAEPVFGRRRRAGGDRRDIDAGMDDGHILLADARHMLGQKAAGIGADRPHQRSVGEFLLQQTLTAKDVMRPAADRIGHAGDAMGDPGGGGGMAGKFRMDVISAPVAQLLSQPHRRRQQRQRLGREFRLAPLMQRDAARQPRGGQRMRRQGRQRARRHQRHMPRAPPRLGAEIVQDLIIAPGRQVIQAQVHPGLEKDHQVAQDEGFGGLGKLGDDDGQFHDIPSCKAPDPVRRPWERSRTSTRTMRRSAPTAPSTATHPTNPWKQRICARTARSSIQPQRRPA